MAFVHTEMKKADKVPTIRELSSVIEAANKDSCFITEERGDLC